MAIAARIAGADRAYLRTLVILAAAIVAAWGLCVWAELSGTAAALHHHALYESGRPLWVSALIVLAAWQVMTAAMMLPSSLGFIRMYAAAARNAPEFPQALALFLASYFGVWTVLRARGVRGRHAAASLGRHMELAGCALATHRSPGR